MGLLRRTLLFVLLFIPSLKVNAVESSCASRDFRQEMGPARDQGELGWCYAYATADLISQRVHHRVSALDVAMAYSLYDSRKILDSRDPKMQRYLDDHPKIRKALQNRMDNSGALGNQGVFAHMYALSAEDPDLSAGKVATERGLSQQGGDISSALLLYNLKGFCPEKDYSSTYAEAMSTLKKALRIAEKKEDVRGACLGETITDPYSIFTDARAWSTMKVYEGLVDKKCQRQPLGPPLWPEYEGAASIEIFQKKYPPGSPKRKKFQDGLLKKINQLLDQNKAMAIDYSAYLLVPRDGDKDDGDHSSLIVGRKMIHGSCHYLIRNSFGEDCQQYRRELRPRCERGHIWVTEKELRAAPLFGITSIR